MNIGFICIIIVFIIGIIDNFVFFFGIWIYKVNFWVIDDF